MGFSSSNGTRSFSFPDIISPREKYTRTAKKYTKLPDGVLYQAIKRGFVEAAFLFSNCIISETVYFPLFRRSITFPAIQSADVTHRKISTNTFASSLQRSVSTAVSPITAAAKGSTEKPHSPLPP